MLISPATRLLAGLEEASHSSRAERRFISRLRAVAGLFEIDQASME